MPEYLAPAVYVEEVDTGSKPIEGVSTSTTGMIGVTERGPVNVPILVTSYGEFQRWFGQTLNRTIYGEYRFLPHAVEGYFLNGGKRVWVTRILDIQQALAAQRQLVAPDVGALLQARLLLPAPIGANAIVVEANPGFAAGDAIQIDDGLSAEFQPTAGPAAAANTVILRIPAVFNHANPETVDHVTLTDAAGAGPHVDALPGGAVRGTRDVTFGAAGAFAPALAANDVLRFGPLAGEGEEIVVVAGAPVGNTVTLRAPLRLAHGPGTVVNRLDVAAAPGSSPIAATSPAAPGSSVLLVNNNANLTTPADAVRIGPAAGAQTEFRRIGALSTLAVDQSSYANYPAGGFLERMTQGGAAAAATDLTAAAAVGDSVITVLNRTGMAPGRIARIGAGAQTEFLEIVALPAPLPGTNPGNVQLRGPLRFPHGIAANVVRAFMPPSNPVNVGVIALDAPLGSTQLVSTRAGFNAGDFIRVTLPAGGPFYHTAAANSVAIAPQTLPLTTPLALAHTAGVAVTRRTPMMTVRAIDAGVWGNRLRVAMEPQNPPQFTPLLTTRVRQVVPGGQLRLESAAFVEPGTELLVDDGITVTPIKVQAIDRLNDDLLTLEPTTALPMTVVQGNAVRSREYRFVVELLRQPDPANPARNTIAIDREVFANLSLDPRHSRYFQSTIGATWVMTTTATTDDDAPQPLRRALRRADRRSEGESNYVRVLDLAPGVGLRAGPVATYQPVPGGNPRLVLLPLSRGDDRLVAPFGDPNYIGADDPTPEQRTGLYTLRNVEDISIVAAPGRTAQTIQNALINHCELMRYRFAVLDGQPPPADSMANIQAQRQQFDTKYAALYHPWLLIPDPYAINPAQAPDYPIPPSGHMTGIYARTDIERGVHKAPANEVVRGVIGLQRVLNKEQHDILNPYPVNINVIRDFRSNNRGIRVYGGRCITSDSDWKYVNVRRLLIFIEASIDRGLQWVVFEPNAEPLWARVRRAISNFLTLVWRNGALEGTRVEEAYFVKCDRTTMTQTDIDQGRLICLVGVAPVKPAEFVIVRIGLWTAHAEE